MLANDDSLVIPKVINELHSPDKDYKDEAGDVGREIKDLSRHRSDLYLRVKTFLTNLAKVDDGQWRCFSNLFLFCRIFEKHADSFVRRVEAQDKTDETEQRRR